MCAHFINYFLSKNGAIKSVWNWSVLVKIRLYLILFRDVLKVTKKTVFITKDELDLC